ncbi:MAG: hypothetical protein RR320_00740 [Oscillospiraceae bacterium]
MALLVAWSIAAMSTAAFLTLWFREVLRELTIQKNMVQSAKLQLGTCQKLRLQAKSDPDQQTAESVLCRSQNIYCQSILLYNQALQKPWNYFPGRLMGFKREETAL